jgi:hypothetical protein
MGGHENFAFNLAVKLSVELDYVFLSLGLQIASMSSALLSVLLVILRHSGKFSNMLCSFLNPHVRHFSDGKQCVQR